MTKNSMKVLVTGGAGFIGSHTIVELLSAGMSPVIVDDFRNSKPFILDRLREITNKDTICYNVDCTDEKALRPVFEKEQPDAVIHFAAYKAVGESVEKPIMYYDNNIGSLVTVLKLMQEFDCKKIIFSSSCTVYGNPDNAEVSESTPMGLATSPYGYTKQAGEALLQDLGRTETGVKSILLRYFNPIGAHTSALIGELPIGVPNNLVPFITQTAAGQRPHLSIFGNDYATNDGTCIRDYIHVSDLADAHVKALLKIDQVKKPCTAYNVGTGKGSSVQEVVDAFIKVTGQNINYKFAPRRSGDVVEIYANGSKCRDELGWHPKYSLEDALLHAWKWQESL